MQDYKCTVYWVEDAEVEQEDRGFGEEYSRIVDNIDDIVELFFALVLMLQSLSRKAKPSAVSEWEGNVDIADSPYLGEGSVLISLDIPEMSPVAIFIFFECQDAQSDESELGRQVFVSPRIQTISAKFK